MRFPRPTGTIIPSGDPRIEMPMKRTTSTGSSRRQFIGNTLNPYNVMLTLEAHRFPEAIPQMARFFNAPFARELARKWLVEMTCVNFGGNTGRWLVWYESHKTTLWNS